MELLHLKQKRLIVVLIKKCYKFIKIGMGFVVPLKLNA